MVVNSSFKYVVLLSWVGFSCHYRINFTEKNISLALKSPLSHRLKLPKQLGPLLRTVANPLCSRPLMRVGTVVPFGCNGGDWDPLNTPRSVS